MLYCQLSSLVSHAFRKDVFNPVRLGFLWNANNVQFLRGMGIFAYYRYYEKHELTDKVSKDDLTGETKYGDSGINRRVLGLDSSFPTKDPVSLLGGTLIHGNLAEIVSEAKCRRIGQSNAGFFSMIPQHPYHCLIANCALQMEDRMFRDWLAQMLPSSTEQGSRVLTSEADSAFEKRFACAMPSGGQQHSLTF